MMSPPDQQQHSVDGPKSTDSCHESTEQTFLLSHNYQYTSPDLSGHDALETDTVMMELTDLPRIEKPKKYHLFPKGTKRRMRRKYRRIRAECSWLGEHVTFFVGTVCATVAAMDDLRQAMAYVDTDDDDDDDNGGSWENPMTVWTTAKAFSVASTVLYILSAVVASPESSSQRAISSNGTSRSAILLVIPALFTLGALFDLGSSLFEDDDSPWLGFVSEVLSVHFFLFCAIWTMSRHFTVEGNSGDGYRKNTRQHYMIVAGDALFLLGALIDVATSYGDHPTVSDEEGRTEWLCNASLGLASSVTWMLDSILYLIADMCEDDEDDKSEFRQETERKGGFEEVDNDDEDTALCSLDGTHGSSSSLHSQ